MLSHSVILSESSEGEAPAFGVAKELSPGGFVNSVICRVERAVGSIRFQHMQVPPPEKPHTSKWFTLRTQINSSCESITYLGLSALLIQFVSEKNLQLHEPRTDRD